VWQLQYVQSHQYVLRRGHFGRCCYQLEPVCKPVWVLLPTPAAAGSADSLSVLRTKVSSLATDVANRIRNNTAGTRDLALQVYGVTLSADPSPPGNVNRN
jgi:hypothetical protein